MHNYLATSPNHMLRAMQPKWKGCPQPRACKYQSAAFKRSKMQITMNRIAPSDMQNPSSLLDLDGGPLQSLVDPN